MAKKKKRGAPGLTSEATARATACPSARTRPRAGPPARAWSYAAARPSTSSPWPLRRRSSRGHRGLFNTVGAPDGATGWWSPLSSSPWPSPHVYGDGLQSAASPTSATGGGAHRAQRAPGRGGQFFNVGNSARRSPSWTWPAGSRAHGIAQRDLFVPTTRLRGGLRGHARACRHGQAARPHRYEPKVHLARSWTTSSTYSPPPRPRVGSDGEPARAPGRWPAIPPSTNGDASNPLNLVLSLLHEYLSTRLRQPGLLCSSAPWPRSVRLGLDAAYSASTTSSTRRPTAGACGPVVLFKAVGGVLSPPSPRSRPLAGCSWARARPGADAALAWLVLVAADV